MALSVDIRKALGNFHLAVQFDAGDETLALLGASGCGKSVTLKCIAGILTPDEGHIELDGVTLYDSASRINLPPQRRQVGSLQLIADRRHRSHWALAQWEPLI